MRDLQLLHRYLVRLRQERLQLAHSMALTDDPRILDVKVCAHEAELCNRIHAAVKVLEHDPAQFIEEFLKP